DVEAAALAQPGLEQGGEPGSQRCAIGLVLPDEVASEEGARVRACYDRQMRHVLQSPASAQEGPPMDPSEVVARLRQWAAELGFSQIGVAGVDLSSAEAGLRDWLARGFHGEMHYMAAHGLKRARPAELVPGTVRVITARMDYLPQATPEGWQAIEWARMDRPL